MPLTEEDLGGIYCSRAYMAALFSTCSKDLRPVRHLETPLSKPFSGEEAKQGRPHYARTNGELSTRVPCIVLERAFYENTENTTGCRCAELLCDS